MFLLLSLLSVKLLLDIDDLGSSDLKLFCQNSHLTLLVNELLDALDDLLTVSDLNSHHLDLDSLLTLSTSVRISQVYILAAMMFGIYAPGTLLLKILKMFH